MPAARFVTEAPRWVVLGALVFAPWFYGGTTEEGIVAITWWLSAAVTLWLIGVPFPLHAARAGSATREGGVTDRRYNVPLVLVLAVLVSIAFGWWMVLNAQSVYDGELAMFVHVSKFAPRLPGSVDQAVSAAWMWRATALLGTLCIVADACRNPVWLMRVCTTVAATGGSIALLGLLQKASRAPMIFWREVDQPVTTFFATFFYHGNAGAFLSMTLPVTIGVAIRAFTGKGGPVARALWSALATVSIIAAFANTSRMGHAVALAIVVVLAAGLFLARSRHARAQINWSTATIGVVALLLVGYSVIQTAGVERSLGRWDQAGEVIPLDARWVVAKTAARALPEAGWFGFGPGTFHVVFPYLSGNAGERARGFWRHLHQDYLQTMLEWGWLGTAVWAVVFIGGMAVAVHSRLSARAATWRPRQRLLLPLVVLGVGAVAVHAAVDFPLQIASIQLYAVVYLGICWSALSWKGKVESRK